MNGLNLIYNPDHQQVLEHHKELLNKAKQAQLKHIVTATSKRPLPSFRKWLQHWFSDRRTTNMVQVPSKSSSSRR